MDTRSERPKERFKQQYRKADQTVERMTSRQTGIIGDLTSQAEEVASREQGYYTRSPSLSAASIRDPPTLRLWTSKEEAATEAEHEARWAEQFSKVEQLMQMYRILILT